MKKHLSLPCLLFGLLLFAVFGPNAHAQSDKCPRIYREGETLRTDPAQSYQWYRNGEPIPGATEQSYTPNGPSSSYAVQVEGKVSSALELGQPALIGQAFDEHLRPVANATISIGNRTTTTNAAGRFQFDHLTNDSTFLLRGQKAGHWTSQRRITPNGRETYVQLMLRSQPFEHELSGERGGTISRGPFFLTLQPNGVLDSNNQPYTGVVKIALNGGRPDDPNFGWMMPGGDFMAQDAQGRERILYSYGFLSAHLQSPSGQPLKLDPNIGAQLRFVMPHTMVATAPDSLPLWHFDEAAAIWKEEGFARREGAAYVGTVRHFSSWNCDVPTERATVRGRVLDCKGRPITRSPIRVGQALVTTDTSGLYTSFVPSQIEFEVKSLGQNQIGTLNVRPLQPEVVENLSDLQSNGSGLFAYSIIDTNNVLTIHSFGTRGNVTYSIDSGATYQTSNIFSTQIDSTYQVLVKDSMDCPAMVKYMRLGRRTACELLDSAGLAQERLFSSIEAALGSNNPVYKLELKTLGMTEFSEQIITYLPCLHTINLFNNNLTSLPESIGNLTQLKELTLHYNRLASLPESIGNLTQLQKLSLDYNPLTSLPESIENLTKLLHLSLEGINLTSAPESIGNLTKLINLSLQYNQLTSLTESIGNLTELQILDLRSNKLTSLPESIGNLTKLTGLHCTSNNLTSVPESIGNLTQMKNLDLRGNKLTSLPESIRNLTKLQSLSLDSNNLTSVPESIGNLTQLVYLSVTNNQIASLPESIGNLTKLIDLSLQDNQLTSLPESIGNLTKLLRLYLDNNNLTSLPGSIGNLTQLQALFLKNNPIPPAELERIRRLLPNCEIQF